MRTTLSGALELTRDLGHGCSESGPLAPLVRPNGPRRHTRPTKRVQHRPSRDPKMLPDISEGPAAFVQRPSDVNVRVREHPIANLATRAPDDARHRPTIDPELFRQRVRRLPRLIALDDLGSLWIGQSGLFLAERWDGSMGHPITSLTRENAPQTRHDVGFGVTTHKLHWCCRSDNVWPGQGAGSSCILEVSRRAADGERSQCASRS